MKKFFDDVKNIGSFVGSLEVFDVCDDVDHFVWGVGVSCGFGDSCFFCFGCDAFFWDWQFPFRLKEWCCW